MISEVAAIPIFRITDLGLQFAAFDSNVLLQVIRDLDMDIPLTAGQVLLAADQRNFEPEMEYDERFVHVGQMLESYTVKGMLEVSWCE